MATTGNGSAHRHKTKAGYWSDRTDTDSGSPHSHSIDLSQYVLKTAFDALVARLAKLEPITFSFTTRP